MPLWEDWDSLKRPGSEHTYSTEYIASHQHVLVCNSMARYNHNTTTIGGSCCTAQINLHVHERYLPEYKVAAVISIAQPRRPERARYQTLQMP